MTRYQRLFKELTLSKTGAFVPFVSLGDPDFYTSINIINTLVESGSDALELGIPFSDPLADGPNIQNAFQRALNAKIDINSCFKIIDTIRKKYHDIPIGLLTYANLVFKNGIDTFYSRCMQHKIDSILIADLPIEESGTFRKSALQHKINQVFICPPNADDDLIKKIATHSQSYTYLTSRSGVTGNAHIFHVALQALIKKLHKYQSSPILQGFGISSPKQAKKALSSGIIGVISGSAIANIIENNIHDKNILFNKLKDFVSTMKNALKNDVLNGNN